MADPGAVLGTGRFTVVALVTSMGGLDALTQVLGRLPADFPAAVVALQHLAPEFESRLPEILGRRTELPVRGAEEGDLLEPGVVLIPPEGKHLLVGSDERVHLIATGRFPPSRPSADLLLSTLAVALGPRVLAVVLTGRGEDGALGAQAVHSFGGRTLVQDQESSVAFSMPAATMLADHPSPPLPLVDIAAALVDMIER